jgi:NADH-quinone oxidoreductase subunit I
VKGHVVTFKNLFRKKVTLQYPEVRWQLPEGYRGCPTLPLDSDSGKDRCIGCGACARVCPTQLITVESHMGDDKKRVVDGFTMDIGLCMFCGLCAEACPTDAIHMSDEYEMASFTRDALLLDRTKLNEKGGVRTPKPKPEKAESSADGGDSAQ